MCVFWEKPAFKRSDLARFSKRFGVTLTGSKVYCYHRLRCVSVWVWGNACLCSRKSAHADRYGDANVEHHQLAPTAIHNSEPTDLRITGNYDGLVI